MLAVPAVKAVSHDNPDVIIHDLPGLDQETDFVVADGPESLAQTSRSLLLRAHLGIFPCKASMLEVWELAKGAGGGFVAPLSKNTATARSATPTVCMVQSNFRRLRTRKLHD